jgi:hypothetical protein
MAPPFPFWGIEMRIKYEGPWERRDLRGFMWQQGETLDVPDDVGEKALRLDGFVKARGRPKKVTDDGEDEPERD